MASSQKLAYLALSAFGDADDDMVTVLSQAVAHYGANIDNVTVSTLGAKMGVNMLVSGLWNDIAKLEAGIAKIKQQLGKDSVLLHQRTRQHTRTEAALNYVVQVVAIDRSGILAEISRYFTQAHVPIVKLTADTFPSGHTNTHILIVHLSILLPESVNIAALREGFLLLCDEFNLDGILEPERR